MKELLLIAGVLLLLVVVLWFQIGWYALIVAPVGFLFFLMAITPLLVEEEAAPSPSAVEPAWAGD